MAFYTVASINAADGKCDAVGGKCDAVGGKLDTVDSKLNAVNGKFAVCGVDACNSIKGQFSAPILSFPGGPPRRQH